jgi:rubrerythrin
MERFESIDALLDFAMDNEQAAVDFYTELATKATDEAMREVFTSFAKEEMGHKARLQSVKDGKKILPTETKVIDLKIADYMVETEVTDDMSYADALAVAMQKEKAAFRLYTDLANIVDSAEVRNLLLGLAQEEAKHKLRFEIEYDQNVLTEN